MWRETWFSKSIRKCKRDKSLALNKLNSIQTSERSEKVPIRSLNRVLGINLAMCRSEEIRVES